MGRRRGLNLLVFVAALSAALLVGCGGGGDEGDADGNGGAAVVPADANAGAGASVYGEAGCGRCHTLAPAGSDGTIGPNLDESDASFDLAVQVIRDGSGGMPAFDEQLSEQEIRDVAAFVVQSAEGR